MTIPLNASLFHSFAIRPFGIKRVMSGASEKATMSAGRPCSTARLCSPDAPYDWSNVTPWPAGVFWKASMIFA